MVKVLVVEDEASIREMIALNLRLAGMEAVEADSAEAALPLLEQRPGCDAAILGCTELSVYRTYHGLPDYYLDAMEILAERCITACGYRLRMV